MSGRNPMEAIADLALALGAENIKALPGFYHLRVDDQWELWLNGHPEPVKTSDGAEVPPYHAYVEFNGWPAGILSAFTGTFADGSAANIETFVDALEARRSTLPAQVAGAKS